MNRESERKRLEELILEFERTCPETCTGLEKSCTQCVLEQKIDHLLDNGIVVPPVKVGEKLYTTYCYGINDWRIEESVVYEVRQRIGTGLEIFEMRRSGNGTFSYFKVELDKFGKTVFTSREDAVKALEGKEDEGK